MPPLHDSVIVAVGGTPSREVLVVKLRPGNAGSNTAGDHQEVFDQAMDQVPVRHRRHVLVRSDSAGGSKQFVTYLADKNSRQRTVEYLSRDAGDATGT